MQLLQASDMPSLGTQDRVFYYSRWPAALLTLLVLAAAITCVLLGQDQSTALTRYVSYYIAAVLLLGIIFLRGYIIARFRRTNWLVRTGSAGLYIKFRSYLNYSLSNADQTVVFFLYTEIRSARLLHEVLTIRDPEGKRGTKTLRFVEFDLESDVTQLAKALAAEKERAAPKVKHWYGTSSTLFKHYPVQVAPPSFVRLQWPATPSWRAFLATLRPFTQIDIPVSLSLDFTNLAALPREQQEHYLRALDSRGETVTAVYAARRLYGYDLSEAKSFMTKLCSEK